MAIITWEYIFHAASNWDISASNVLTISKTSGVVTKRTNLKTRSTIMSKDEPTFFLQQQIVQSALYATSQVFLSWTKSQHFYIGQTLV